MASERIPDRERAHDVLAAEAFAMPAPDPRLRPLRVVLPEDPSGILEPHDILAAEEFAMPASSGPSGRGRATTRADDPPWRSVVGAAGAGALALIGLRHRRR